MSKEKIKIVNIDKETNRADICFLNSLGPIATGKNTADDFATKVETKTGSYTDNGDEIIKVEYIPHPNPNQDLLLSFEIPLDANNNVIGITDFLSYLSTTFPKEEIKDVAGRFYAEIPQTYIDMINIETEIDVDDNITAIEIPDPFSETYILGLTEFKGANTSYRQSIYDLYDSFPPANLKDVEKMIGEKYPRTDVAKVVRPSDGTVIGITISREPGIHFDVNSVKTELSESKVLATKSLLLCTEDCKKYGLPNFEVLTKSSNSVEQRTFLENIGHTTLITKEESNIRDFIYLPFDSAMAKNYQIRKLKHKKDELLKATFVFNNETFDIDTKALSIAIQHNNTTTWRTKSGVQSMSSLGDIWEAMYQEEYLIKEKYWIAKNTIINLFDAGGDEQTVINYILDVTL